MVKLQKNRRTYFVVIPQEIVQKKGWKEGKVLVVSMNMEKGCLEIWA